MISYTLCKEIYLLQPMNLIFYKQYETIKLILVTVLQSLNQNGIPSFIPYLKTHVATIGPKRLWRYELKVGVKGGIGLFALMVQKLQHEHSYI